MQNKKSKYEEVPKDTSSVHCVGRVVVCVYGNNVLLELSQLKAMKTLYQLLLVDRPVIQYYIQSN